jgi:hypothetical protein
VCAWRWRKLAVMLDIPLGTFEAFSLTVQGMLFSLYVYMHLIHLLY